MLAQKRKWLLILSITGMIIIGCTKKDIQFGNSMGESYTRIIQIDTVAVQLSTYFVDSFPTNSISSFLFGQYHDPQLGTVNTKPYLQLAKPDDITLEDNAVYDSLTFVIKLNKYYYGDTTQTQNITIRELSAPIDYTYNNNLFNTSSITENSVPLGSQNTTIRPNVDDSIGIRLNDEKGRELFHMLQSGSSAIQTADQFLSYFKGVSIGASSPGKSTAVYGISVSSDSIYMRLHYHVNIPYPEAKYKDFKFNKSIYFNQILSDRSGTQLASLLSHNPEVPSVSTNNIAYTQTGAGVLLKITLPSLRNVLQIDTSTRLLKATLILRTADGSFNGNLNLPPSLYLAQTDATNNIKTAVYDSAGTSVLYSQPVTDPIYSSSASYSFTITSTINKLLTTSGSESSGFFLMESNPGATGRIDRAVFNNWAAPSNRSQLILSLFTLKNN
jgi:hypothetical protein